MLHSEQVLDSWASVAALTLGVVSNVCAAPSDGCLRWHCDGRAAAQRPRQQHPRRLHFGISWPWFVSVASCGLEYALLGCQDNGPSPGHYGVDAGSAAGLRGGKSETWEGALPSVSSALGIPFASALWAAFSGGVRVPAILRWPGKIAPGQLSLESKCIVGSALNA